MSKSTLGLIAIGIGVAAVLAIAYMPLFQPKEQERPVAPLQSGARGDTEVVVGEEAVFIGQAGFGKKPYQFEWTFPDDTVVRTQNATHTFPTPGDYTVYLKVSDSAGYENMNTLPVRVLPPE